MSGFFSNRGTKTAPREPIVPSVAPAAARPDSIPDPSMEDILASIRRILNDGEPADPAAEAATPAAATGNPQKDLLKDAKPEPKPASPSTTTDAPSAKVAEPVSAEPTPSSVGNAEAAQPAALQAEPDDVFLLDAAMMINEHKPTSVHAPADAPTGTVDSTLVAPETVSATSGSMGALKKALAERNTQTHSNGPTIEDIIRDEMRPLVKTWLDAHLPPIVERLVRAEIERVVSNAVG